MLSLVIDYIFSLKHLIVLISIFIIMKIILRISICRLQLQEERGISSLMLYHFVGSPNSVSSDPIMMIRRLTTQVCPDWFCLLFPPSSTIFPRKQHYLILVSKLQFSLLPRTQFTFKHYFS